MDFSIPLAKESFKFGMGKKVHTISLSNGVPNSASSKEDELSKSLFGVSKNQLPKEAQCCSVVRPASLPRIPHVDKFLG